MNAHKIIASIAANIIHIHPNDLDDEQQQQQQQKRLSHTEINQYCCRWIPSASIG